MNYFELYPGDYLRDTGHLSMAQHGAFLLLMAAYYGSEKPFPRENDAIYRITKAINSAEKRAAISVADEFFPVGADGLRHNARADEEIAKAQERMDTQPTDRKLSQAERAKRYRDRRAAMFQLLRENGIVLDFNAKAEDLEAAVMGLASRKPSHEASHERDDVPRDVTASRPQTPDPSKSITPEISLADERTLSPGEACAAMRRGGQALQGMNSSHAVLLEALRLGATAQQFEDTAREGASSGKSFGWVVATVKGRLTDAKQPGANHVPAPRESLVQRAARKAIDEERARQALGQDDDGPLVPDDGHVRSSLEHDVR